jgi:hypothetical protein
MHEDARRSSVVAMEFLVGLGLGAALGVVIGTVGFPMSMNWLARREYREASQGAGEGPFPRIEVESSDRFRSPEHVN